MKNSGSNMTLFALSLVLLALSLHHLELKPTLPGPPPKPTWGKRCILYDRPPRTASSTILSALRACLLPRYTEPCCLGDTRNEVVRAWLAQNSSHIGLLAYHVHISQEDINLIGATCSELLYITSARRMKDRLWSVAKDLATGLGGNATLTTERGGGYEDARARLDALGNGRMERYLEKFPYMKTRKLENIVREKLVPDFVIRAGRVREDLGFLGGALGCGQWRGWDSNVHRSAHVDANLTMGDARWRELGRIAVAGNRKGLEKARHFA